MSHQRIYYFDNEFVIKGLIIDETNKIVYIYAFDDELDAYYRKAAVDIYTKPDTLCRYSNGNTNKDEWHRLEQFEFKNLNAIETTKNTLTTLFEFSFDEFTHTSGNNISQDNIPLGKFEGMTLEEIENYKRKNIVKSKDWKPQPTQEAIDAAYFAQKTPYFDRNEIEKILIEAYKIDM